MLLDTYQTLRKQLSREGAFRISNLWGGLTAVGECLLLALGVGCLWIAQPFSVLYWIAEVLLALSAYRMFVILHECGHGSLFRQGWLNHLVGSLASPACLMPYFPWRSIHALHHQWVGVIDKDPTQAHLLKLKDMSWLQKALFKFFWKSWLPVPFIKFVVEVFWTQPFGEIRKGNRKGGLLGLLSLAVCLTPHLGLLVYLGFVRYAMLLGPACLFFYVFFELMNVPQHSGHFPHVSADHPRPIPFREQDAITRTTYLPRWLAVLLCYNFNLHVEHHLFPTVPWYRLPRIQDRLGHLQECRYECVDCPGFMIDFRRQDPLVIYVKQLPARRSNHV